MQYIRFGIVKEVDKNKSLVRIENENVLTPWIPLLQIASPDFRFFVPPNIGEQVVFFAIGGRIPSFAIRSLFFQQIKTPAIESNDKALIETKNTKISFQDDTIVISSKNKIKIEANEIEIDGILSKSSIQKFLQNAVVSGEVVPGQACREKTVHKLIEGKIT